MLALAMSAVVGFISCDNEGSKAKLYDLSVTIALDEELSAEGVEVADLSDITISLVDAASGAITKEAATGETTVVKVKGGEYNVVVSAEIAKAGGAIVPCNGSATKVSCYTDQAVTVTLSKTGTKSGLVIKEIYECGVMSYYYRDVFVEIYNNSDQVEYLDGIIISFVQPAGNGMAAPTSNPWEGDIELGDRYALDGATVYFPGDGDDYPLQPWTSTVVAATAINHAGRELTSDQDVASPVDLSGADWEISLPSSGLSSTDSDTPEVDNLVFGYWPRGSYDFYPTDRNGTPIIIAKPNLGEGMTITDYLDADENKIIHPTYRSFGSAMASMAGAIYTTIPTSWVLDAIEIVWAPEAGRVKVLNNKDDMGMVWVDGSNDGTLVAAQCAGKSLRRKVSALTAEGKPIYKDTNNSSEDFAMGGATPTPGVHPTTVD